MTGYVYLIHFEKPYKHARHYIGYTRDCVMRSARHFSGRGSKLLSVISKLGIRWDMVRIETGNRKKERSWKNGHAVNNCPVCKAQKVIDEYKIALDEKYQEHKDDEQLLDEKL